MEYNNIEQLLEKYFEGQTSIVEEKELTNYFSSTNVAQHLEQYKPIFEYYSQTKQQKFTQEIPLKTKKRKVMWLSIAASVVVLLGVGTFYSLNNQQSEIEQGLGTFKSPEIAFQETQKALQMLSQNVNVGIESVSYIKEFEVTKNRVFIK
jgi:flagellar motility protein MotE (MotC chaperone)